VNKPDGGPAFPRAKVVIPGMKTIDEGANGMSLRDYFAAKAMQAVITKLPIIDMEGQFGIVIDDKIKYNKDIAESAYQIADAMLQEREK